MNLGAVDVNRPLRVILARPLRVILARPRRSAEQALNVPIEKIHQAWRQGKVLCLVSFDVKGVLTAPLARRIREAAGVIRLVENDRKSDLTVLNFEGLPG